MTSIRKCLGTDVVKLEKFCRLSIDSSVYHSKQYKRPVKQNSYTVLFKSNHNKEELGQIEYFLRCKLCNHANEDLCYCQEIYSQCNDTFNKSCIQYIAIITFLKHIDDPLLQLADDKITNATVPHISVVCLPSQSPKVVAVPVSSIKEKCIYMRFEDSLAKDHAYCARLPSHIETD